MSWVYFVREAGTRNVKIGRTVYLVRRLSRLQCGNPRKLTLCAARDVGDKAAVTEAALHSRFSELRVAGEWYRLSPELEQTIASWGKPMCSVCGGDADGRLMTHQHNAECPRIFCVTCAPDEAYA